MLSQFLKSKLFRGFHGKSFLVMRLIMPVLSFSACEKSKHQQITIDSPRALTSEEVSLNLNPVADKVVKRQALSDEYNFYQPEQWETKDATSFRLLNFSFGSGGEIYLSESRGGVLANANRWLSQFGSSPLSNISSLKTISLLGEKAYLVEAKGSFKGMRMAKAVENYSLLGVLLDRNGELITVKMTGPSHEVEMHRESFFTFCQSLQKN